MNNKSNSKSETKPISKAKLAKLAKRIELLAPAGGMQQLRAAIANGANAVYLGLGNFNARRRAENFSLETLPDALELAHANNVRVYVTLNTLVFPSELNAAAEYIRSLATAGVDAIIVQDLGIAKMIRAIAPDLPLHASTQMTLSEPGAINFAARELGLSRVILPRELSAKQIGEIASETKVELEAFIHGAICIGYSGQCFASKSIGDRSANRGQCAQPCRLGYQLRADGEVVSDPASPHLLSPYDLCSLEMLSDVIASGVCSLKIEGRLKSPHYVAAVVKTYRDAIDAIAAGENFTPDSQTIETLKQSFSRGFTRGYLAGENHGALIGSASPKKRGTLAGEVVSVESDRVWVEARPGLAGGISAGDGVAFAMDDPDEVSPGGRVYEVFAPPIQHRRGRENELALTFSHESKILTKIEPGMRVWKTDDPQFRKKWEKTFARVEAVHEVSVDFDVRAVIGKPLVLNARDSRGNRVCVSGQSPLEAAMKRPVTQEFLVKQLGRLGGSGFSLGRVTLLAGNQRVKQADIMVPSSEVNALRREAVEELAKAAAVRYEVAEEFSPADLFPKREEQDAETPAAAETFVLVRTQAQLDTVCEFKEAGGAVDGVYIDMPEQHQVMLGLGEARKAGLVAGAVLPRVIHPGQQCWARDLCKLSLDVVLVRTLGELEIAREVCPDAKLVSDFSLNCANPIAAEFLRAEGFARVTPSFDLSADELSELLAAMPAGSVELPIYNRMPMFHTQYCLWSDHLGTGKAWPECGKLCKKSKLDLVDRKNAVLPVVRSPLGRSTVYSGKVFEIVNEEILQSPAVGVCRLELLNEDRQSLMGLFERLGL